MTDLWQLIDVCPVHKSIILVAHYNDSPGDQFVMEGYCDWDGTWRKQDGERWPQYLSEPTHWQPLPSPPAESTLEAVARALCISSGLDPDRKFKSSDYSDATWPHNFAWHEHLPQARAALMAMGHSEAALATIEDTEGGSK